MITNDKNKVPTSDYLTGCPIELGLNDAFYKPTNLTNGCAVAAYVYPNVADKAMFDCILYASVETFFTNTGSSLFSYLSNVEKITFDCKFSFAKSEDSSTNMMFNEDKKLVQIDGLTNLDTSYVKNMNSMFLGCSSLTTLDLSNFDTSNVKEFVKMFQKCESLIDIKGLESFNTSKVTDMNFMFYDCASLTTLDLSSFDLSSIEDGSKLNNFLGFLSNLEEIKAPKNLNNYTIHLYFDSGMSEIDSSMEGMTLLKGSKEFNILYNTLLKINVCTEYTQAPELQAMYDGLSNEEKDKLATLSDDGGVILTDKLSYMVSYADYKANEATKTAEAHLVISPRTSQYLVIVIACLSLALIGGYYFIQKKKYVK